MTTGRDPADALEGFPSLQFVGDVVWRAEETFAVVEVLPVTDSDRLGIFGVAFPEQPETTAAAWGVRDGAPAEADTRHPDEIMPHETCLIPLQWDAAGRRVAGETQCQAVTTSLCSTTSGSSATAVAVALALLVLGRRGQRG